MSVRRLHSLPLLTALAVLTAGCGDVASPTAASRAVPTTGPRMHSVPAGFSVTPDPADFGSVTVGDARTMLVTVSNPTTPFTVFDFPVDYAGSDIIPITNPNSNFQGCSDYPAGNQLVNSCTFLFQFKPTEVGLKVARVHLRTTAGADVYIDLLGTGVSFATSASQLAFGTQNVGTTSGVQTVTITNPGSAPLTFPSGIAVSGTNAGDFATAAGTTCGAAPVAPGGSCTIAVTFAPNGSGPRAASVGGASSAGALSIPLTGTGVVVVAANVGVSLGGSAAQAQAGKPFIYTMTVRNAGPNTATGVQLTDAIPSSTTFASLTATAGVACTTPAANSTGTVTCAIGSLASGQSAVVTLTVNMLSGGKASVSNTATVTSTSTDPVPADDSATLAVTVKGRK